MLGPRCLASLFLIAAAATNLAAGALEVRVTTSFGQLIGERVPPPSLACDRFLGIPYAEPPVGDLRFAPPQPWREPYLAEGREARSPGATCVQMPNGDGEEDCLFLHIWRPHGTDATHRLPVMTFIPGGGFEDGSGAERALGYLYDGCTLASTHGIVVVSMNYRLGPLGFASFQEKDGGVLSNFGVQDQREAMRWLGKEVANFGGDAARVTLFGQSAGGISVFFHMAAPSSGGLFQAAISESGFPTATTLQRNLHYTKQVAERVGCSDAEAMLSCLRGKSAEGIARATLALKEGLWRQSMPWGPVIDGVELPKHPLGMFQEGRTHPVPLLAGTNTDEGTFFMWKDFAEGMNHSTYERWLRVQFVGSNSTSKSELRPRELQRVMGMYPATGGGDARPIASELFRDWVFLCATQWAARFQSLSAAAYVYRFNFRSKCAQPMPWLNQVPGVFHGLELPFVFNDAPNWGCIWEPEATALSELLQAAWADFAKTGSPGPRFPKYTMEAPRRDLVLQAPAEEVEEDYRADYCRLWDEVLFAKWQLSTKSHHTEIVI